jgi:hypothetical protein
MSQVDSLVEPQGQGQGQSPCVVIICMTHSDMSQKLYFREIMKRGLLAVVLAGIASGAQAQTNDTIAIRLGFMVTTFTIACFPHSATICCNRIQS